MATLQVPDKNVSLTNESAIRCFLSERNICYDRWGTELPLPDDATDAQVLAAYSHALRPFMEQGGYQSADVVSMTPHTLNLPALRDKFFREHTHAEDEVRFFVAGRGVFWFHMERPADEIFAVLCEQGDLISVPANTKHWFDVGEHPYLRAIRIFTDQTGWVPQYTHSAAEQRYRSSLR